MSSDSSEKLVVLTSVAHEMEAGMIIAALERAGIRARASGVLTAGFRAEAPGRVQILVWEDDLEAAEALMEQVEFDDSPVDWSQVDVGDPEPE